MLFIVCALNCEAQPLISYFHLTSDSSKLFPLYVSEDIKLIISGVGKSHSAAAVSYLHAMSEEPLHQAWLNIGIAGHAFFEIGTGILGHKITDHATNRHYYPSFAQKPLCLTAPILTVGRSVTEYPCTAVYEMEAAGFYEIALRTSSAELVHCYKIISDNRLQPAHLMTRQIIHGLIENKIGEIEKIIYALKHLHHQIKAIYHVSDELSGFVERWHFSSTQTHHLKVLLQRWTACQPKEKIWDNTLSSLNHAKEVLKYLEEKINRLPLSFS